MAHSLRDRFGPYELTGILGKGGMGEVFRARDSRLHRDVALKMLPAELARDPQRLARFTREAQILAGLNHANIATLYGLEEANGVQALAMELVEGPTLAERIGRGPVPAEEAIPIALQIAEALEYAHDRGVVHRDLKPANVTITLEGRVKVLDFGLAKALTTEPGPGTDPDHSATHTTDMTAVGVVVGTAGYMSPEQIRAKQVDRRSDIWAFGVVLMEMLTGERVFAGGSVGDIFASVIKDEVPLGRLPAGTPAVLRRLVARCLHRDPTQRLQHMGEARILLQNPAGPDAMPPSRPAAAGWLWGWIAAALFGAAAAGLAWVHFREAPPAVKPLRFQIPAPGRAPIATFRISPDGRHVAFVAGGKVWVRSLHAIDSKELAGTEGATYPFWSPDSEHIGFFAQGKLKRIPRLGGSVQTLAQAAAGGRGGSWARDDVIVFSAGPNDPILRVAATGGTPTPVTTLKGERRLSGHRFPEFLPDGRHFLYLAQSAQPDETGVYLGALDAGNGSLVLTEATNAMFAPDRQGNGFLLFRRADTLMAQPFDPERLKITGEMFPVMEGVTVASGANSGFGAFAVAQDGTLVVGSPETPQEQLVWVDRSGRRLDTLNPSVGADTTGAGLSLVLSPDGRRVAFSSGNNERAAVWVQDVDAHTPVRLTFGDSQNTAPRWSPDSTRLLFATRVANGYLTQVMIKRADGADKEDVFLPAGLNRFPFSWSPDGKWVAYSDLAPTLDIWLMPLEGERTPVPFLATPAIEQGAWFSPDGKFLTYQSDESGEFQIYVQPVPPNGSKWLISRDGGTTPQWKGSEIYFLAPNGTLMAAPAKTVPSFSSGPPQALFVPSGRFAPASEHRFLLAIPASDQPPPLIVVTDWHAAR